MDVRSQLRYGGERGRSSKKAKAEGKGGTVRCGTRGAMVEIQISAQESGGRVPQMKGEHRGTGFHKGGYFH